MVSFVLLVGAIAADPKLTPNLSALSLDQAKAWSLLKATARVTSGDDRPPYGTAVCIGTRGKQIYLLTADHVLVRGEARVFDFYNEASYPQPCQTIFGTQVLLRMPDCDAALLQCIATGESPASVKLTPWLERPRRYPTKVFAFGCPSGSAPKARQDQLLSRIYVRHRNELGGFFWQTKNPPTGGMSGGPLFDHEGRLLGVCAARFGNQGYFGHLDELLAGLKREGYGWLLE